MRLPLALAALVTALLFAPVARASEDEASVLWKARCANCHGQDGKAKTKMGEIHRIHDFTNPKWQRKRTDRAIRDVIARGVPDTKMKPFKDKLTPQQIDRLVAHIRELRKR